MGKIKQYSSNMKTFKFNTLLEEGKFITGCNYWASHAGTNIWSDWRPDVIEKDF